MFQPASSAAGALLPVQVPVLPPRQVAALATAVIESLFGRRPLHHLRQYLSRHAFEQLVGGRESGRFTKSQIASWRWQMPTPTSAEVSIRISLGNRWLVCVMRLDLLTKWHCSDFRVLGL